MPPFLSSLFRKAMCRIGWHIRTLFCRHRRLCWLYNLFGDQIISHGWKRTAYTCVDCGKFILKGELVTRDEFVMGCPHDYELGRNTCRMCHSNTLAK